MTWFKHLTGFSEESPEQVRANLFQQGDLITSSVNGRSIRCGESQTPSLGELRELVQSARTSPEQISVRELVAEVQSLHINPENAGAVFQVASQFNLLEMISPERTPEDGVGIYQYDRTQGPACAVAAGAGTIYRNYFINVNGLIGQSSENQIDCLADLGTALGNDQGRLWQMKNGYALATSEGLSEISMKLNSSEEEEIDGLRQLLRVGIQSDTEVTASDAGHLVTQVYCSALPVAYSALPKQLWAKFASLVLEAAYEAAICAAILNSTRIGNNRVFLTMLGGGAFGNDDAWIVAAIERTLRKYSDTNLEVAIVSYGWSQPKVRELVKRLQNG